MLKSFEELQQKEKDQLLALTKKDEEISELSKSKQELLINNDLIKKGEEKHKQNEKQKEDLQKKLENDQNKKLELEKNISQLQNLLNQEKKS